MIEKAFRKVLSGNDLGTTGGHQAGILVPKSEMELINFLPSLDPAVKNPSAWIQCFDEEGEMWEFRYIHYNNKLHDEKGTRNEYRITHMTKFLRCVGASEGDSIELSQNSDNETYLIRLIRHDRDLNYTGGTDNRVKLRGWRRVH